ncbi:ATP-binding cassette domain-containing protein [Hoyosella rhizosphaerae]|uniref:Bacteriocin ABC transporter ATP-binding protein n=1 Tax=Hoyosella rhizosphaerae TaxID=1755582 RepID=A0A916X9Y2_9ACTN|nr:ATP-binding cassette domain-containing protein [Hoyosella rhizosphaerae]MBN4926853.1 ATP-binding cassette domain-containing protein [Hoyosella rhizosphaerae]GGC55995.1 bacteriocin ABC transporter ATP-binding protein [Hoyosella rhizosphaerae]
MDITIAGLSKSYGSHHLWRNLDLTIPSGRMLAITGKSGSGKSTLLNCIGLIDSPDAGSITVDGADITTFGARRRRIYRRNTVGYLFQDYALVDNDSAYNNVRLAFPSLFVGSATKTAINEALAEVGLSGRGKSPAFSLSGGEQQRVALARLLVKNPPVILADEPTGALDASNAKMVIEVLRGFADAGATVVIATHDPTVTAACDDTLSITATASEVA